MIGSKDSKTLDVGDAKKTGKQGSNEWLNNGGVRGNISDENIFL